MEDSLMFKNTKAEQRFWSKVIKTDTCWEWIASRTVDGYGTVGLFNGKVRRAHRVAYANYIGEIPPRTLVCHTCDNPPCVNPAHLFLGTHLDNLLDCIEKGRFNVHKGSQCSQTTLTENNVREIRRHLTEKRLTHKQIGNMFGVSKFVVRFIAYGKTWKHVH